MRSSNIELCRIASILLVLLVHSAFAANGYPQDITKSNIWLIVLESLSIIGVNVFIFISGYFSIKLKPKTIYTLFFACGFYWLFLTCFSLCLRGGFELKNILFISNSHYFILDYLGLALLSPILNKFSECSDKRSFAKVLILLIIYQTYFDSITGANSTEFDSGYSLMSFSIIYLIARYIRIYGAPAMLIKWSGTMYVLSSVLLFIASVVFVKLRYCSALYKVYAYDNPIVIFSTICFFLIFLKMKVKNSKLINTIAKSTLGVLLFHASTSAIPTVWTYMKHIFNQLAHNISIVNILIWLSIILVIFVVATVIDQIRIYLSDKIFEKIKINNHGIQDTIV